MSFDINKIEDLENAITSVRADASDINISTRDSDNTFAFIYVPSGRECQINTSVISSSNFNAWWYNPRNCKATKIGTYKNT